MNSFISPFCISAFVVFQGDDEKRYLLIRRAGKYLTGTWQMVSGGVQEGEKADEAALREIREETGFANCRLYSADIVESFYFKPKDAIAFVPVFVAFVDKKEPVHLAPDEHDAYAWLTFEEAHERLVFGEQKRAISHIHQYFVMKTPDELHRLH